MYTYTCPDCGSQHLLQDVLICPFCLKFVGDTTPEYIHKHMKKCSVRLNPYIYSKRKRGRPSKEEVREALEEELSEYEDRRGIIRAFRSGPSSLRRTLRGGVGYSTASWC